MGALDDIDLLTSSCNLLLPLIEEHEDQAFKILEVSGATSAVNALRALRVQKTTLAIGMFSMYEAVLQDGFGFGKYAFDDLEKKLKSDGHIDIAKDFEKYRLAINVLKHGSVRSYDDLLKFLPDLEFNIQGDGSEIFEEGNVNVGQFLVHVDSTFVRRCAELIEISLNSIRA